MISTRFPSTSGLKTRDAETHPHVCVPLMHESLQDKQDPISIRNLCMSHNHDAIHATHSRRHRVYRDQVPTPSPKGSSGGAASTSLAGSNSSGSPSPR